MKNPFLALAKVFSVREAVVFGGLGVMTWGIYQRCDWLALTICGGLLMLIGLGWLDINNWRALNGLTGSNKQRDQGR